jgi:hypothetical protein
MKETETKKINRNKNGDGMKCFILRFRHVQKMLTLFQNCDGVNKK